MRIVQTLAGLAVRPILRGFLEASGGALLAEPAEKLVGTLIDRFTSHSGRLSAALADANNHAWKSLEIAMAGDSWWQWCKKKLAPADEKDFAGQVDLFLKNTPLGELGTKALYREECVTELRAARKAGLLTGGQVDMATVLSEAGPFAQFTDPTTLLDSEWQAVDSMSAVLAEAGYRKLAQLLALPPSPGSRILVTGVRFFFRHKVETDPALFQGLTHAQLEAIRSRLQKLAASHEAGFTAINDTLAVTAAAGAADPESAAMAVGHSTVQALLLNSLRIRLILRFFPAFTSIRFVRRWQKPRPNLKQITR